LCAELYWVMLIFRSKDKIEEYLAGKRAEKITIGFVPTMGALHAGHLSLIGYSKENSDITVCSIFVNPTQFNNPTDLEKYPRSTDEDIEKLKSADCDVLFLPEVKDIYPEGQKTETFDFGSIETVMEGEHRPGHFNGVGTVVSKFFDILKPTRAYFGEKDYQQFAIIKKLVELKNYSIEIIPCPILRETDGLAMSSRNVRLTPEERKAAPIIHQALTFAQKNYGSFTPLDLKRMVIELVEKSPFLQVEYVEISDANSLKSVEQFADNKCYRIFIALFAGNVRLIDNQVIK